jgi:hypothetical protein
MPTAGERASDKLTHLIEAGSTHCMITSLNASSGLSRLRQDPTMAEMWPSHFSKGFPRKNAKLISQTQATPNLIEKCF